MCCPAPQITVYDADEGEEDDALGMATIPIAFSTEGPIVIENLVMEGQPQDGAVGYCFPDSELSFSIEFKGVFAGM